MNTEAMKQAARMYGADLVGVAPIERLKHLKPENSPAAIFPQCCNVIVVARRILRGSLRGVEEGTNFNSTYGFFGFQALEDNFLSKTTYDLTCWLEAAGAEAVPLFAYEPASAPMADPVAPGKPAPNVMVDYRACAQAAGLGEYGKGGFFLTPEFGPRQRFALILTDAELTADEVVRQHLCRDCSGCAEACPFGAIDMENLHEAGVPGHGQSVAQIDMSACAQCRNGAWSLPGRNNAVDRFAARCGRQCVIELEKRDALSNRFNNHFRQSEPWQVDAFGKVMEG